MECGFGFVRFRGCFDALVGTAGGRCGPVDICLGVPGVGMARVFVSHAGRDRVIAGEVAGWLSGEGHELF